MCAPDVTATRDNGFSATLDLGDFDGSASISLANDGASLSLGGTFAGVYIPPQRLNVSLGQLCIDIPLSDLQDAAFSLIPDIVSNIVPSIGDTRFCL